MGDIERAQEPYSPDMSDAANHIALLAMERDGLQLIVADLECALANARADASDCCDGYEGQIAMLQAALKDTHGRLAATAEERDSWKDGAETLAMQVKDLQRALASLAAKQE